MKNEYIKSHAYGKRIATIPNALRDNLLIDYISKFIETNQSKVFKNKKGATSSIVDQTRYQELVAMALENSVLIHTNIHIFSECKDHLGRDIKRYIISDDHQNNIYIIDVYSALDVRLEMSKFKRFLLNHLPWKHLTIDMDQVVPVLRYMVRIWNTPVGHYDIQMLSCPFNTRYTSKIDQYRSIIGLPKYYDPKEIKSYERVDFDIRRVIFNEMHNVQEGRASVSGTNI